MEPLVSILIPAYNAELWLADSVRSALAQTWPNKEIVIVDDGSKDGTLAVAQSFASDRVIVIAQKNQGAAAARNRAYAECHGDYIQWLDADDLLGPEKVAKQMQVAKDSNRRTLLSSSWGAFYYRPAKTVFSPSPLWADMLPVDWLRRKLGDNCFMQTATWLVSRELTEAAGLWNTKLLGDDDGEYFCRVLMACDGIKFVPEARVFYRDAASNRLSFVGWSPKKLEAHFHSMKLHIGYVRSLSDDQATKTACLRYLQRYMYYFYRERPDIVEQMEAIAAELGGTLEPPHLAWKYRWIQTLFGWNLAKRAQFYFRSLRGSFQKNWDKSLYKLGM